MPRKATTDAEAVLDSTITEAAPVRRVRRTTPRKRAVDADADSSVSEVTASVAEKRPVRRRAPVRRVSAAAPEVSASPVISGPVASSMPRQSRLRRNRGVSIVVVFLLIVGVGVSAVLGFSDQGVIDVTARMNEQLQLQAKIAGENGEGASYTVPVQNTQVVDVPNGGLRGRGINSGTPTPPPPPLVTASTTETASTSDVVAEEVVEEPAEEPVDESEESPIDDGSES